MDLFNWYIDFREQIPHICGDVVVVPLRQKEFEYEKYSQWTRKKIAANDEIYRRENVKTIADNSSESGIVTVLSHERVMKFIREPIGKVIDCGTVKSKDGKTFALKNCDRFFLNNKTFSSKCRAIGLL